MAIPVVSPNTPSEGYIQWESFSIQYLGQTYTIPQGNTNLRWVWWKYNSGGATTLLDAGQDLPEDLDDNDLVILGNKNGIPLRIQSTSLVDGDLLIDGSVFSKALDSEAVTAEVVKVGSLSGDLFEGELVLGSTISTGDLDADTGEIVGPRVELGPDGLKILEVVSGEDKEILKFPLSALDTSFIKSRFEMLAAEVLDDFIMRGKNNSLATESELQLAEGVLPPSALVKVSAVYDTVQLDKVTAKPPHAPRTNFNLGTFALNGSQITSMDWDSDWNCWVVCQQLSSGMRIWRFGSDGSLYNNISSGKAWIDDSNGWTKSSICFDGEGISHLGVYGGIWYIEGRTQAGLRYINRIPAAWITDTVARPPALAYDHVNNQYMILQSDGGGSGRLTVRRFWLNNDPTGVFPNAQTGTLVQFEAGSGLATRMHGLVYGSQVTNGGAARYVVSGDAYMSCWVYDTAGAVKDDEGSYECWAKPGVALGLCHTGTQFASVDSAAKVTLYENWNWNEVSSKAYVSISAYDSTAGNGSLSNPHTGQSPGQHETPVSTPMAFGQSRRAKLRLTVPETNDAGGADDPDKWKLYYSRQPTPPSTSQLKHVATLGSDTSESSITISADPIGGAPPGGIVGTAGAFNNFPQASPATIRSTALDLLGEPLIQFKGSGAARTGDLTVDEDGTVYLNGFPLKQCQGGSGNLNATVASTNWQEPMATVTFPYEFRNYPSVSIQLVTAYSGMDPYVPLVRNLTKTGFTVAVKTAVARGATPFLWTAVER